MVKCRRCCFSLKFRPWKSEMASRPVGGISFLSVCRAVFTHPHTTGLCYYCSTQKLKTVPDTNIQTQSHLPPHFLSLFTGFGCLGPQNFQRKSIATDHLEPSFHFFSADKCSVWAAATETERNREQRFVCKDVCLL